MGANGAIEPEHASFKPILIGYLDDLAVLFWWQVVLDKGAHLVDPAHSPVVSV
jgi:hypothetical protein